MSLDALLNDFATVVTPPAVSRPGQQDNSGAYVRSYTVTKFSAVPVRIEDAAARLVNAYAQRGQAITHTVYTTQGGIAVKDMIQTSDGRNLMVEGVRKRRGLGSLPDFYSLDCLEYRQGA